MSAGMSANLPADLPADISTDISAGLPEHSLLSSPYVSIGKQARKDYTIVISVMVMDFKAHDHPIHNYKPCNHRIF